MKSRCHTSPSTNQSNKEHKRSRDECSFDRYSKLLDNTTRSSKRNHTTIEGFKMPSSDVSHLVTIFHRGEVGECDIRECRKQYYSLPNDSFSSLSKNSSQEKGSFNSFILDFSKEKVNVSKYSTSSTVNLPLSYPPKGYDLAIAQPKTNFECYRPNYKFSPKACKSTRGLVGLKNLGNTCYMNTILQCLFHCDSIVQYFIQREDKIHVNSKSLMKGELARSFSHLCHEIYHPGNHLSSVNPVRVKNIIATLATQFDGIEQQDAHELLRFLLDGLDEDLRYNEQDPVSWSLSQDQLEMLIPVEQGDYCWSKHASKNSSFITDTFCGQFRSIVTCTVCGHKSYCFDPFYDLSLPIPNDSLGNSFKRRFKKKNFAHSSNGCTLHDCLEAFVYDEALSNANKIYCKRCKKRQDCRKSLKIERAPSVLVLHLKRFNNSRRKKNNVVSFPTSGFDFSRFLSDPNNSRPVLYDLFAVCHHSGSPSSGHYIA